MKVTLHYITIAVSLNALYVTSALRDLMTWNHRTQVYFYGWTDSFICIMISHHFDPLSLNISQKLPPQVTS